MQGIQNDDERNFEKLFVLIKENNYIGECFW